jgi:hypothetical protein
MFRVPVDAESPTFDDVFKVSFWRWLTSRAADRHEWRRRRDTAAQVAQRNRNQRTQEWADRKRAEHAARKAARSQ